MVPFDVVTGRSWMIGNSGCVTNLSESFEVLVFLLCSLLLVLPIDLVLSGSKGVQLGVKTVAYPSVQNPICCSRLYLSWTIPCFKMVTQETLLTITLMIYWTNIRTDLQNLLSQFPRRVFLVLPYLGFHSDAITRRCDVMWMWMWILYLPSDGRVALW